MNYDLANWEERRHATLTEPEVKEIVESWRSGRLVDREAIDYEAAERAADMLLSVHEIIDAAIGDTK